MVVANYVYVDKREYVGRYVGKYVYYDLDSNHPTLSHPGKTCAKLPESMADQISQSRPTQEQ